MSSRPQVVFVCEHGAAKSVLAASEFNRRAEQQGLAVRAIARGTVPDAAIASVVVERLAGEGIVLGSGPPQALTPGDLAGAIRVVSFDQPQVAAQVPAGTRVARWDGLPAVSADFDSARRAIRARVQALHAELAREADAPA